MEPRASTNRVPAIPPRPAAPAPPRPMGAPPPKTPAPRPSPPPAVPLPPRLPRAPASRKLTGLTGSALFFLLLALAGDAFDRGQMLLDDCIEWQDVEAGKSGCERVTWTTQTRASILQEYGMMSLVTVALVTLIALAFALRLAPVSWIAFVVAVIAPWIWGTFVFGVVYVPLVAILLALSIVLTRTHEGWLP